jgi:hypothetical protein
MLLYVVNSFSAIPMNVPSIIQFDYIILDPIMVKKTLKSIDLISQIQCSFLLD